MADLQPAGAPQIMPFGVSLTPEQSNTTGGGTTTPVPFGATKANPLGVESAPRAAQTAAGRDIVNATKAQGAANVGQSQAQTTGAQNTAGAEAMNFTELQKLEQDQRDIEADARARKLDLQKRVSGFQLKDYFDGEGGTLRRVIAAISSGLLGFGTGQYHNVAKEIADDYHNKQMGQLDHLEKQLAQAGADEKDIRSFGQEARANLKALHAQRLAAINAETNAQAARYNTPSAQAAANLATATAARDAAKLDLEADAGLRGSAAAQHSETKNQNAKGPAASTEPAEKGAEAQILGTAADTISHGFVGMNRRQTAAAEKAARETFAKTKTTGEGAEQVQEMLGTGSPIEGLGSPGERSYARALVIAATSLGKKNGLPPGQALETLMPRSDGDPKTNARALKNLHDVVDSMTPQRQVILPNGQRGVMVNGKVVVQ